ncbi:MAG: hypothetical protein RLZZ238_2483 [Planctomycetota bacterium]
MTSAHAILCPYCGHTQPPAQECRACGGCFDRWSIQATQDEMGAWFVRDSNRPHFVGYSYPVLVQAIRDGVVGMNAIVRGPTTRQFWTLARRVPGLAHHFARCFACQAPVSMDQPRCASCGVSPPSTVERNFLGLAPPARVAPPADARPDHSAFIEDSGVLLVHVEPILPVGEPNAAPRLQRMPLATPTAITVRTVEESAPAAPASASASRTGLAVPSNEPRSALTPIHRGIADRARRLEVRNRLLLGFGAISFIAAIVAVLFSLAREEAHRREIDARVSEAVREARRDFERTPRVVIPPPAELPPMPESPAAGGINRRQEPMNREPANRESTNREPTNQEPQGNRSPQGS